MADKAAIKKVAKADNLYELKMTVTLGKIMSIVHALRMSSSPVAPDALWLIDQAIVEAGLKKSDFGFDPEKT